MLPRQPKRLLIFALICGNVFLLYWILSGNKDDFNHGRLDINEEVDYFDKVAVAQGKKMKIYGALPPPPRADWQSAGNQRDELIIDEINYNDEDKREFKDGKDEEETDVQQLPKKQPGRFAQLRHGIGLKNRGAPNQKPDEYPDDWEDDDYYKDGDGEKDPGGGEQKQDVFQGMHRNKKRSNDLFPPRDDGTVDNNNIKGGEHYPSPYLKFNGTRFVNFDTRYVHHCVTREIIGHVPANLGAEKFSSVGLKSPENRAGRKASFHKVFVERSWGKGWDKAYDRLDASGRGAQLSWAQEFISTLQLLINDIKTTLRKSTVKILDVPCGDMAWMSRFLVTRNDIDYLGVDIVPELIENHRKAYRSYPWKFELYDVIDQPVNESYDIIINRMLLQHLYYGDVFKVLRKFSDSGSTFLVTTTFLRVDDNRELSLKDNPGRIRKLNLEIPPVSLTPPLCVTRDGPPDTFEGWDHFAGVWKLPLQRLPKCREPKGMKLRDTDHKIYSCVRWSRK